MRKIINSFAIMFMALFVVLPIKSLAIPADDQVAYVKSLGYAGAIERFRGDTFILFDAYFRKEAIPSSGEIGSYSGSSNLELVMVHYVDHSTPIFELEKVGDGQFRYPDSLRTNLLSVFGVSVPTFDFTILHFIHNYRSKVANTRYKKEFLEVPIFSTRFDDRFIDGTRVMTIKDEISSNPNLSATIHCVEYEATLGNTNSTDLAEVCEGYQPVDNVLADLGYLGSKTLFQNDAYAVYEATLPGSQRDMNQRGKTVFVMVHNIGPDDPIFGISEYEQDPSKSIFDKEFVSKMENAISVQEYRPAWGTVYMHHHVANVQPSWSEYFDIQSPVLNKGIRFDGDGGLMYSLTEFPFESDIEIPPRSANEYIASVSTAEKYYQAKLNAKPDNDKKKKLLAEARLEAATSGGYVIHDRDYWDRMTQLDGEISYLERYFNGDFDYTGFGYNMKIHFIQFVNHYSTQCKPNLQPNHATIPIVTTERWVNQYGVQQGLATQSTRNIYVDQSMANAYATYWNELNAPEDSSAGGQEVISEAMDLIRNVDRNMNNFYENAEIRLRPLSMTTAFFTNHECASSEMTQLKENLTRASREQPSIQAAATSENHSTKTTELLYEFYNRDHATLGYANTPIGWLPGTPEELLKNVSNKYGPSIRTNGGAILRQGVEVEIDGAATGSLKSMVLSSVKGHPDSSDMIWILRDIQDKNIYLTIGNQQMYVECKYSGGGYYAFWYEKTPEDLTHQELRRVHAEHPFLAIQPPQEHCPAQLTTPTSWQAYTRQ